MLPRSDVPFPVSEFIFPAIISPVKSRAASHRSLDSYSGNCHTSTFSISQPIKGSTSISNSQEPHALSSAFIKSSSIMPTSGLSSNTIISTSPVSIRGTARTKSSSLRFTYEASTKPSSESYSSLASPTARLESIFTKPEVIFSSSCAKSSSLLVVDKCAMSTRRPVSHMVSSSASSHVYAPTPVKRDDEVKSSQLSSTGLLQLNQSPVLKVPAQLPASMQNLQSTEFNSLLTSVIHPVSIKSPSVRTESAASNTRRLECSGIDSPPHVVDNTSSLTPFTIS
uniref:Uncharacterized protein n=1 Tax=Ditylenchus dipsaci TaxID=166011 RepID=A0A915DM32_9BILA